MAEMMQKEQPEGGGGGISFKTDKTSGERSFYDTMWINPRYPLLKQQQLLNLSKKS